jgi:hypothetical protein
MFRLCDVDENLFSFIFIELSFFSVCDKGKYIGKVYAYTYR